MPAVKRNLLLPLLGAMTLILAACSSAAAARTTDASTGHAEANRATAELAVAVDGSVDRAEAIRGAFGRPAGVPDRSIDRVEATRGATWPS